MPLIFVFAHLTQMIRGLKSSPIGHGKRKMENVKKKLEVTAQELKHSEKLMQIAVATPVCLSLFSFFFLGCVQLCHMGFFSAGVFPAFRDFPTRKHLKVQCTRRRQRYGTGT